MVQGVEKLGSKLRMLRFPDCEIFVQREIEIVRIRTDQSVTTGISKNKLSRTINFRIHVCGFVEPIIYTALSPGKITVRQNLVRPLRSRGSSIRPARTRRGKH